MEKQHQIRLTGTTADGVSLDRATEILGKLFKKEPERLRPLLSGKPITLPTKLTEEQAGKVHAYLNKAGIPCEIEAPPEPEPQPQPEPKRPEPAGLVLEIDHGEDENENDDDAAGSIEPMFECPKCGAAQERGEICIRCGLVFEKYYAQHAAMHPGMDPADVEKADNEPDPDDLLEHFVSTNTDVYMRKFHAIRDGARATWHWPAFFVPFYWTLYRKMWFMSVVAFITQIFWPLSNIVFGLIGNQLYYQHASGRVETLSKKFRGRMLFNKLEAHGGTTWTPVIIALVLTILLNVLLFKIVMDGVQEIMETEGYSALVDQGEGEGIVFLEDGRQVARPPLGSQKEALVTSFKMASLSMQYAMVSRAGKHSPAQLRAKLRLSSPGNSDGWGNAMQLETREGGYRLVSAGADGVFETGDEVMLNLDEVQSYQ